MLRQSRLRLLKWFWEQLDTILALFLSAVCSILGLIGVIQPSILIAATLGILTVLAFALMRDRQEREKLRSSLDQIKITSSGPGLDVFLDQDLDEVSSLLKNAELEIWIVQETGTHVVETNKSSIVSFLRRGGTLKIIVSSPKEEIAQLLASRSHDFNPHAIITRTNLFRYYIDSITKDIGSAAEQLQVRYIPYVFNTLSVVIDPQNQTLEKRKAVVQYPGFRTPFGERPIIGIYGDTSPRLFSHFYQEAYRLFEYASKIILITGMARHTRKEVITRIIEGIDLDNRNCLFYYFISEIPAKDSKPQSIEIATSNTSKPCDLAICLDNGKYDINKNVLTSLISELEQAYKERKILVLDEIGPFLIQFPEFLSIIDKILNDPFASLFATLTLEEKNSALFEKLSYHYRSSIFRLTQNQKSAIEKILEQEMRTSLHAAKLFRIAKAV